MIRLHSFRAVTPGYALAVLGLVLVCPVSASAQDALPPAHVSYVDGSVFLDRDAGTEDAESATPIVPGDRLRTQDGRAELLFGDGSLVQLDVSTTLDLLSDARLRLLAGRLAIVASRSQAGRLQVDTPSGSVEIASAGEYRVWLFDDEGRQTLELSVIRGVAELVSDRDRVTVDAGQRSWARAGEAPAYPVRFNAANFDAFDQWALDRAAARRGTTSARYVPATLQSYAGVLDTYGSWSHEPTYGYVWYPRVAVGWRPYYHGRWHFYAGFGWTWVGGGAWGWPTHHYGRWGLSSVGAWFWIPGATWGPAWVSWAVAPGYVSWCPLGYNNYPVFGFWGHRSYGHYRHGYGHEPWRGWTVVPRQHFGGYRVVSGFAVDGRRFAVGATRRASFVLQDRGPAAPTRGIVGDRGRYGLGVAVPRGAAGAPGSINSPGPRASSSSLAGRGTPALSGSRGATSASAPPLTESRAGLRPSAGTAPRALPGRSEPGAGARTRARPPGLEMTPENAARTFAGSPAASRGVPRASYPNRLPGDIGARTAPGSIGGRSTPPQSGLLPGQRGAVPRSGGSTGWSPDQVPVHRGMRIEPDRATAPSGSRIERPAIGGWRGDQMRSAPPTGGAPRSVPGMAQPRGSVGGPRGDSMRAPGAYGPPAGSAPAYRGAPPSHAAPPAARPPAGAPRQAPSGARGGGGAVPRNGPPPSRHR